MPFLSPKCSSSRFLQGRLLLIIRSQLTCHFLRKAFPDSCTYGSSALLAPDTMRSPCFLCDRVLVTIWNDLVYTLVFLSIASLCEWELWADNNVCVPCLPSALSRSSLGEWMWMWVSSGLFAQEWVVVGCVEWVARGEAWKTSCIQNMEGL